MHTLDLFMPLTKVDRRLADGARRGDRRSAGSSRRDLRLRFYKALFRGLVGGGQAASGGKSLGAVRAMHQRIAAGKLTDIAFDDEGKRILVAAKIVDDDEWRKVVEGVYTGFSQGGRYVARWTDENTGLVRYTAEPTEISLVDVPCLPGATFQVVKDGIVEERAFVAATVADRRSRRSKRRQRQALRRRRRLLEAPQGLPSQALAKAALAIASAADKLERAIEENSRLRAALGPRDAATRRTRQARRLVRGAAATGASGAAGCAARTRRIERRPPRRGRGGDQDAERAAGEGANGGADEGELGESEGDEVLKTTDILIATTIR